MTRCGGGGGKKLFVCATRGGGGQVRRIKVAKNGTDRKDVGQRLCGWEKRA